MGIERLIFGIGPLPNVAHDLYALFFVPPRDDTDSVFTEDIREGLRATIEAFPDDRLVVTADLFEEANSFGLPLGRLDETRRSAMISTAYVVAIGEQLTEIQDRSAIVRLARAGARLAAIEPWTASPALGYVTVSVDDGSDRRDWEVAIIGPPDGEAGFTAYQERGAISRLADAVRQGRGPKPTEFPSLALSLNAAPPYVAKSLQIALGTGVMPRPIALEKGEMKLLTDRDLATVCALTESIMVLAEKGKPETIAVKTAGIDLRATARPFNPAD